MPITIQVSFLRPNFKPLRDMNRVLPLLYSASNSSRIFRINPTMLSMIPRFPLDLARCLGFAHSQLEVACQIAICLSRDFSPSAVTLLPRLLEIFRQPEVIVAQHDSPAPPSTWPGATVCLSRLEASVCRLPAAGFLPICRHDTHVSARAPSITGGPPPGCHHRVGPPPPRRHGGGPG